MNSQIALAAALAALALAGCAKKEEAAVEATQEAAADAAAAADQAADAAGEAVDAAAAAGDKIQEETKKAEANDKK